MATVRRGLRPVLSSLGTVGRNPRLLLAAATWGTWTTADAGLLVTLSYSAYQRGGAAALGTVLALRTFPAAVASPIGSVIADRISRTRLLLATLVLRAALVAAVPLALHSSGLLWMWVLVAAMSAASTPFNAAILAILPQLVQRTEELTAANAAYSLLEATGTLVGPVVTGLVLAVAPPASCYFGIGAIVLVGAVLAGAIRTEFVPPTVSTEGALETLAHFLGGFPALFARKIRSVAVVAMAQTAMRGVLTVSVVAITVSLLHDPESNSGVLLGALGAGGLVGAVLTMLGTSWRPAAPFFLGMCMWGLPFVLIAVAPHLVVIWLAIAAVGIGNAVADVFGFSLLQALIPDHKLGRAFGVFWGLAAAAQAVGALLATALIEQFGVRTELVATGTAMLLVCAASWFNLRAIEATLAVDPAVVALLRRCRPLTPLTEVALEQLARSARQLTVQSGDTLIAQGDTSDDFYVIAEGRFEALVDGRHHRTMATGDCFGEIAAINRTPRTASVVCRSQASVLSINGEAFFSAVTGFRPADHAARALVDERSGTRPGAVRD